MFATESPLLLRLVYRGAAGVLASIEVEALDDGAVVLSVEDFASGDVDFGPAFCWARCCTVEGCPMPPRGWALETC